ncbi:MAG: tetratricopeptide repeat protein [Rhodanobacteraceae bacterium]|nr:tetratricopeptide repeat protein [Pseudomonadota bacterium]
MTANDTLIAHLRAQLDGPRDGALLRYSLGNALLSVGEAEGAVEALRAALQFDPDYSAAWKWLGKAQLALDDATAAANTWRQGIAVAHTCGDVQAEKEMRVFLKRVEK